MLCFYIPRSNRVNIESDESRSHRRTKRGEDPRTNRRINRSAGSRL